MQNGGASRQEFELGDIIWTFGSGNRVTVEYNISMSEVFASPPLEPGSYNYTVDGNRVRFSDDSSWYDFYFEDGQLIIEDDPELDGPIMIFEKF